MNKISITTSSLLIAGILGLAPVAQAIELNPNLVPDRTQITLRIGQNGIIHTPNADEPRYALSMSKLYLGYWVLNRGADEDAEKVEEMIRVSDDEIANELDKKYPQAIPEVISILNLTNTHYNNYWGATTTSTNDVAKFLWAVEGDPGAGPIIRGMNNAAPIAADGYRQDFGTANIPGVTGTKFGWSNDRRIHATASIGPGFYIAANTMGGAEEHTSDVLKAVTPEEMPKASSSSGSSKPDALCVDLRRAGLGEFC